jgi:type II secretory pathway component GspD/PulD (secretin)
MSIVFQVAVVGVVAVLFADPVGAQRGAAGRGGGTGQPPNASRAQAQKQDTTKKPGGVSLDFQDQELRVVLDALAAAGELNVSLTNIPAQRVTLHMGKPVTREAMIDLVKNVAESNGLKVTQTATLIQISGPAPVAAQRPEPQQSLAQQLAQQNQQQQMRLFTFRLKHASAIQLAPVLTNLFSGFSGTTGGGRGGLGTTIVPNGNGGFSVVGGINSPAQPPGNITTGDRTNIPTPFGGRGGGGNAGRGGGGGNPGVQVLSQLANAFQQASGSLSSQSGDIRIIAEESTNSLLIRATESDFALVQQIIQGVDLRPLQVLIEVTIAEVQRTHDLDLGVSGNAKRIPKGQAAADVTATAPAPATSTSGARDFILELVSGYGTIKYDVALAALEERGDVKVLSLPVIIAQNNKQAVLNVGSSRPFVQVSQTVPNDPTGRVQTVQYIDVGTVLTITPTINPDGYVNLQIQQQDNSATNQLQFDAPIINKREATTQVFVRDGQTTVIGGLADNTKSHDVSGIPYLSRIPFVGPLIFGRTVHSDATSELFLFLTPHIISTDEDVDKYRDALRDGSELLKQLNVGPHIVPRADTLAPSTIKPDTSKKTDSLTMLRRRPPPPARRDSTPPDIPPVDTLLPSRQWR